MKKIIYKNNCKDGFNEKWAENYIKERKSEEWDGEIEIKEKTENCICASVDSRGSNFIVVLSRYYKPSPQYAKMGISDSWCVCVPNWEIGITLEYLDKSEIFYKVHKTVTNKVDCISLVNAIWELSKEIREKYYNNVSNVLNSKNK